MMKIFKSSRIIAGVFTAVILISLNACSDLLEPEVYDRAEASKFPQNEKELLSTVGATYGQLRGYYGTVTVLNSATSDEMVVPTRGPDWFDNASWQQMAKHDWTPVSPGAINGSWEWAYRVIAGSNINIKAISASPLQVDGKDAILAELRLLRAFAYYSLMDMFGNVPIITETSPAGKAVQNTRAEVYAFVVKEITEALPRLRDEKGQQIYGRFTKGAANTLLAKVYLNAQVFTGTPRWQEALAATNAVISSPAAYSLTPNYLDNFAVNNGSNSNTYSENILAVPYDKVLAGGMNWQMRTLHYAQGGVYGLPGNPWNGFATRADFYNSFSDGDARKAIWLEGPQKDNAGNVIRFTDAVDNVNKELNFTPKISSLEKAFANEGVRNVKYEVQRNNNRFDQDNDFALFRFADVLLMKAEASLRLGNSAEALTLVNRVRERAKAAPLLSVTLDVLLAERGREFAWEGWRRNDLIRFGKWSSSWEFKSNNQPHRSLFPVPAQQISNNPNLKQNTGY